MAWSAVTDAEGGVKHYVVYRDGNAIGTSASLSLQDTGLTANTTYSYQVATVDSKDREGQRSSSVTATTPADATPPTTPTGLQASAAGPGQVDLTWQPASDAESGVASYRMYRDGVFVAQTSATSFSDAGVQPQTMYSYEVSAVNGAGLEGSRSTPASVTTPAPADTTPPTTPTGLQTSVAGPGQVDLTWQPASDAESGVASYRVYRDGAFLLSSAGISVADTTAEEETTYSYEVSAVNGAGLEGSRSAPASVTTSDTTPPAPPRRLRIVRNPG